MPPPSPAEIGLKVDVDMSKTNANACTNTMYVGVKQEHVIFINSPFNHEFTSVQEYSLGGHGQDPKGGLVGPLTQPPQLKKLERLH